MPALYCTCDVPVFDPEHDAACRRCGRPLDFTPPAPVAALPRDGSVAPTPCPDCGTMIDVARLEPQPGDRAGERSTTCPACRQPLRFYSAGWLS